MELMPPWQEDNGAPLVKELERELAPGHVLYGVSVSALAHTVIEIATVGLEPISKIGQWLQMLETAVNKALQRFVFVHDRACPATEPGGGGSA